MQAASLSKIWRFDRNVGPEEAMDPSSFQGVVCTEFPKKKGLSVSERRELIHALSKQPDEASELLNSWSRDEIMKIICAEMGKERKYTGLAKPKLIENLLNLVSRPLGETSCPDRKTSWRRKKQKTTTTSYIVCCENSACRAALGSDDTFCKRCCCCVCQKFDDNKDPSLWIACEACGLTCHLECALKEDRCNDGRFHCVFCGKDSDLLGSGLCSNPSLPQDEPNNVRKSSCEENGESGNIEHCSAGEVESELEEERLVLKRKVNEIEGRDSLVITPCKRDTFNGKQVGTTKRSKSRTMANKKTETSRMGGDKDLGRIVKTIRCLEQAGHIDKSFRERFLTWYSLRATNREVIVAKVFVETFEDDLSSLGQQLVDTFSECILSKRSSSTTGVVPAGVCLKLWH